VPPASLAIDLDGALGDTRQLWDAWLEDASRRLRVDLTVPDDRGEAASVLDRAIGNWRPLLERFAEEHAPVYLRPRAEASLREGVALAERIGYLRGAWQAYRQLGELARRRGKVPAASVHDAQARAAAERAASSLSDADLRRRLIDSALGGV
jgi:hypothetical protein